jgi:hypothetical protein
VSPQVAGLAEVVGRERELDEIRSAFATRSKAPAMRVLTGMGGVGKTSLARAYAQRHLDDYGIVWWVRAEDPAAVDLEFRGLLEIVLSSGEATQIRDAVVAACAWLGTCRERWLLVLDNVPDAAAIRGLIPARGNGNVLLTTQATRWPNPSTVLRVDPLDRDSAVDLLMTLSRDENKPAARELAKELGGLPLALAQAASFVHTHPLDLATYLRFYRDRTAELLDDNPPDDYPHTVATTWQVAIDKLPEPARNLLNLLAHYAPDSIPISLFTTGEIPLLPDELAVHRAVGELLNHSLVTHGTPGAISVHRLIQSVTRHHLATSTEWSALAARLITSALPSPEVLSPGAVTFDNMKTWNQLRTHAYTVVSHARDDDSALFPLRYCLANWTGLAGNARKARDQMMALLKIRVRILGPEHDDTLMTMKDVAYWTDNIGNAATAQELLEGLLPLQLRALGPEHPSTLTTQNHLATKMVMAKKFAEGRELLTAVIEARERVLGPEHKFTLYSRCSLAFCIVESGDYATALDVIEPIIRDYDRVLGLEYPDALLCRSIQAQCIGRMGDPGRARDMFAELFSTYVRVIGFDQKATFQAYISFAMWSAAAGNPMSARHMLLGLLTMLKRGLGKKHPVTIEAERALGSLTGAQKKQGKKKRS